MVSIVIPVYNGSAFLRDTLVSCIMQTYQDIEIIVVDDCSTDNSEEVIKKIEMEFESKINYIKNNKNMGFCASANIGVAKAIGDFVIVLGQDDLLEPTHIEYSMPFLMKPEAVAVYCGYSLIDEHGKVYKNIENYSHKELKAWDFAFFNPIHSCGLVMKKKAFDNANGYPVFERFPQYGEWYLWIELIKQGDFVYCNKVRPKYRRHGKNITNDFYNIEQSILLNEYWDECRKLLIRTELLNVFQKIILRIYIYFGKVKRKIKRVLLNNKAII